MADEKKETIEPAPVVASIASAAPAAVEAPKTFADSIPARVIGLITGETKLDADQVKTAINALKLGPAGSDDQVAVGNQLSVIYGPSVKYGDGAYFPGAFDVNPVKAEAAAAEGGGKKK